MKYFLPLVSVLLMSFSAYSATIVSCSKSVLLNEKNGVWSTVPVNVKIKIEQVSDDKVIVSGNIKSKKILNDDNYVQSWDSEQTKAFIEMNKMMGGPTDMYRGMSSALAIDSQGSSRLSLIVGKNKAGKVLKVFFTTESDQMGFCQ